jgi:hypothetical protein
LWLYRLFDQPTHQFLFGVEGIKGSCDFWEFPSPILTIPTTVAPLHSLIIDYYSTSPLNSHGRGSMEEQGSGTLCAFMPSLPSCLNLWILWTTKPI